jgi:hypothetical protein
MFPDVRLSRSVEGPVGPHLFRMSTTSSELSFDQALQMSPVVTKPKNQFLTVDPGRFYNIDDAFEVDTPVTTISETAYRLPHLGKSWQSEDPRDWTTQQVTVWMEDSGVETEIVDLFVENDMAGTVLWDLQFQDLKDLGIASFGKRHQVWNLITALREQFEDFTGETPLEEKRGSRSSNRSLRRDASRRSNNSKNSFDSCEDESPPPGAGTRRRRKVRRNGYEPVTPADSVSIVAIEQLLPKPHVCKRGENCEKTKRQRRMLERLEAEKSAFPISPGAGGRIYMIGNPGNAATANRLLDNVRRANFERSAREEHQSQYRPNSGSEPSVVGPSVVASSDLLGPGELPDFSLDPERLRLMGQRDPQDNVMQFLTLQHADPPSTFPSPFEGDSQRSTPQPEMRLPEHTPLPLMNLQSLPKLQIPTAPVIPFHNGSHLAPAANESILSPFSPCRTAAATPVGANLYRFGTPASEMDVPVTQVSLGPIARETSQSVPPDMHFKDPVQRSASRPNDWRRPSFQLPVVAEETGYQQPAPVIRRKSSEMPRNSSDNGERNDSSRSASPHSMLSSRQDGTPNVAASSVTSISQYDQRYTNVMHSGWMKKRKTRLLRHEWNEHHFRLTDKAQLTMHKNDISESSPLESLNIDDYSVACSSLASNKLSAKLKALRMQNNTGNKDSATQAKDAAFSFQLVPGSKKGGAAEKKTHHFAVKTRDQRLDWMRELMLAKAQREREGNGYEVEVVRGRKSEEIPAST